MEQTVKCPICGRGPIDVVEGCEGLRWHICNPEVLVKIEVGEGKGSMAGQGQQIAGPVGNWREPSS